MNERVKFFFGEKIIFFFFFNNGPGKNRHVQQNSVEIHATFPKRRERTRQHRHNMRAVTARSPAPIRKRNTAEIAPIRTQLPVHFKFQIQF